VIIKNRAHRSAPKKLLVCDKNRAQC